MEPETALPPLVGPAMVQHETAAQFSAMVREMVRLADRLGIKGALTRAVQALSGGNQQKVALAKWMPSDPPTAAQRDPLWRDITYDIDRGYALVANIVAPASNHPPCFPSYTIYHYVAVVGYKIDGAGAKWALVADPANFCGDSKPYWLTFNQLATLIPRKGYSA